MRDKGEVTLRGALGMVALGALVAAGMVAYRSYSSRSILDGAEAGLRSDLSTREKTVDALTEIITSEHFADDPAEDERARRLLVSALSDSSDTVVDRAIDGVRRAKETSAVEELCRIATGTGDDKQRIMAMRTIQSLADSEAMMDMIGIVDDEAQPEAVRIAAIDALGTCGGVQAVAPLLKQRLNGSDDISAHAGLSLTKIRSKNKVLQAYGMTGKVGSLNTKLGQMQKAIDDNQKAMDGLLDQMEGTRKDRAGPMSGLYARLDSPDVNTRLAAVYDLEVLGKKSSVVPLIDALDDENETVRKAVRTALVKITRTDKGEDQAKWRQWHLENARK